MRKEVIAYKKGFRVTVKGDLIGLNGNKRSLYNNKGYYCFTLRFEGVSINIRVHRLQAFQKYGMSLYDEGIITRHKNSISTDNSYDNILIGTASDNMMDVPEEIRIARSIHAASFLKKYNNDKIKKYHKIDNSYKDTMDHFDISSKGTLHFILNK